MAAATALVHLSSNLASKGKILSELKKSMLRPLVQLAVKSMEQPENIQDGVLERIAEKYNLPLSKVGDWYSAVLTIIKFRSRTSNNSIKNEEFNECLRESNFQNECIRELSAISYGPKRTASFESATFFPRLKKCLWRIDIAISSSWLSRVSKPVITMEWILSTGQRRIFELSLSEFHLARRTLAGLLLEIRETEYTS